MKKISVLIIIFSLLLLSCESYNQEGYEELVFVESYLVVNRTLPSVRISTTSPINDQYSFRENALTDANVQISLLDDDGNREETFAFFHSSFTDGVYLSFNNHRVLPRRTYQLEIDFNNRDEIISAETTVPDQFEIVNEVRERVVYQSDEQVEIVLTQTETAQRQNIFVFNTLAQKPEYENLTPFYRNSVDNGNSVVRDFVSNSSGLINEGSFDIEPDGTIRLRFPWLGVAFFEENLVVTNSVDQNIYDLIRSQEVQLGGSTLPPGEIPNLIYNMNGAIGVFGSLATDTVKTFFERPSF